MTFVELRADWSDAGASQCAKEFCFKDQTPLLPCAEIRRRGLGTRLATVKSEKVHKIKRTYGFSN